MVPAALREALREGRRHDVLVVRSTRVLGMPGLLAARWLGRPVILQPEVNGELSGEAFTWGWTRGRALDPVVRAAGPFPQPVAERRRRLRGHVAAGSATRCWPPGCRGSASRSFPTASTPSAFGPRTWPSATRSGPPTGSPTGTLAVFTGRLLRGKGLETLVAAFAEVAASRPDLHLVLVGSGSGQALSVEEELRAEVHARGLAAGWSSPGASTTWRRTCGPRTCSSSRRSSRASGSPWSRPPPAASRPSPSRTGGILDVVDDGRSGLLVTPGRVDELASALGALAGDPALRARMGVAARRVALARFDRRDSALRYRALFRQVTARR